MENIKLPSQGLNYRDAEKLVDDFIAKNPPMTPEECEQWLEQERTNPSGLVGKRVDMEKRLEALEGGDE